MVLQPDLATDRLSLRSLNLKDAARIQQLAGNFNVSRFTLNIPHPYEDGMAEDWISSLEDKWQAGSEFAYAMVSIDDEQLIGVIGLHEISGKGGELGYWIGEPYWGQGYCAEASREIIRFSFSQLGLNRIQAQHVDENHASGRVLQKIGMTWFRSEMSRDRYGGKSRMQLYEIQKN